MRNFPDKNALRLSRPVRIAVGMLFVLSLWMGGLHWFTRNIEGGGMGVSHTRADAIVALTGGSNRLQTAFDLLDKGLGEKLFISGVYRGVEVQELLALAKKENTSPLSDRITLGFDADDTIGNARETVAWLAENNYKSFYLVTANYHLKRAQLEFKIIAPALDITPYPVTPEGLDMRNWWRNKTHRTLIIREYMKYLVALARYTFTDKTP